MRFTQTAFVVAALSAVGLAQSAGACDPQNDNGVVCSNGTPVSSDGAAIDTNTVTNTVVASTDNPRISVISSTDTDVLVSTTRNVVLDTTSLPHSLDTRTSTYLNTVVLTSGSAYVTNTLNSATASSGSSTSRSTGIVGSASSAASSVASSVASSATSSGGAAAAMQTAGSFASFGVAVAAIGFAAAL
ncbi:hypothetical protein E4T44_05005 [Aureobasidium sp. EXF-8845]|nr:hypothetical protein E4T44_05005 [Aureobasidium sp. EXF-8845]KAI4856114.1 hypothetical protein E4T45_02428 [Aureobasidium sp. EXF-8846]